ncbi:MAG: hypothetical protein L6Q47_04680 [Ignavibacteriaceae bacterium]|nr:hypothetical protein [Ignavibacteriaceae bacterium]
MKKTLLLAIVCFMLADTVHAQVTSISFYSDYSAGLSKRIKVTEADAVGGGLILKYNVMDWFSLNLTAGYTLYSVSQDSALQKWNWDFWEIRYRNRVAADLAENPGSAASLVPVQKMDILPVLLSFSREFELTDNLKISPEIGGGVYFYTRRMYLAESWQRRFDSYGLTYEYSYRNFATNKYGNPAVIFAGAGVRYIFTEGFSLEGSVKYQQILKTEGSMGYNEFIFENALSTGLALVFSY